MRIREGRASDAEALYALDLECFAPPFRFNLRFIRTLLRRPESIVRVAEVDGEAAGFIVVEVQRTPRETAAYVATIDVRTKRRRAGLGRELLAEAEMASARAGATVIWLHVHEGNVGAKAFYERAGFACGGRVLNFYGEGLDALVYGRGLHP